MEEQGICRFTCGIWREHTRSCAAKSLARVWRDRDKVRLARALLAPAYAWSTGGSTRVV
jgi:hypothetical protein